MCSQMRSQYSKGGIPMCYPIVKCCSHFLYKTCNLFLCLVSSFPVFPEQYQYITGKKVMTTGMTTTLKRG